MATHASHDTSSNFCTAPEKQYLSTIMVLFKQNKQAFGSLPTNWQTVAMVTLTEPLLLPAIHLQVNFGTSLFMDGFFIIITYPSLNAFGSSIKTLVNKTLFCTKECLK